MWDDRKGTHSIAACLTDRPQEIVVSFLPGRPGRPLVLVMPPRLLRQEFGQLGALDPLLSRVEGLASLSGGALAYPRVLLQRLRHEGPRADRARQQDRRRRICVHVHGPTISGSPRFKPRVIIVDVLYTYRFSFYLYE